MKDRETQRLALWLTFLVAWRHYKSAGTPGSHAAAMQAKHTYNMAVHEGCWSTSTGEYGPGPSAMIGEAVRVP